MSDQGSTYKPAKWSFGILNPESTDEVPGSILLLPQPYERNEPLGLRTVPSRTSSSNFPVEHSRTSFSSHKEQSRLPADDGQSSRSRSRSRVLPDSTVHTKKTQEGIILVPQPEDSKNDPLNWKPWRRDLALLCLGFYCFIGGGMTPILAAGFSNVAATYDINVSTVSLSTGFYMLGMGIGGVFASPTAILFGKRPVYIVGAILFVISAIWCALSPDYPSLVVARVFQGIAISPCEALPSATIAEIYFLHERAYRIGIYTLLLLGGKNLIPLISAAIINSLSWQWVFWIVAMLGAFGGSLLFLFVPETFWDRAPKPKRPRLEHRNISAGVKSIVDHVFAHSSTKEADKAHLSENEKQKVGDNTSDPDSTAAQEDTVVPEIRIIDETPADKQTIAQRRQMRTVGFAKAPEKPELSNEDPMAKITIDHTDSPKDNPPRSAVAEIYGAKTPRTATFLKQDPSFPTEGDENSEHLQADRRPSTHRDLWRVQPQSQGPKTPDLPDLPTFNSPSYAQTSFGPDVEGVQSGNFEQAQTKSDIESQHTQVVLDESLAGTSSKQQAVTYTEHHRHAAPRSFLSSLRPWNGRLRRDNWFKAAVRPFILYAYPSILWSSLVYSLSVGWLIVLSESVTVVYRSRSTYNFTAIQCGLVYLSPFIGGILGTAVAGKISDLVVRWMARRNGGIYEPEFRLVMAGPILLSTVVGLMGFGWAAEERDAWIVPTVFFGIISFGCSLGSTTAITFAVDSYRQYAAEALVTLNFSKNVLHGFVFSLFFTGWLESAGSRSVFLIIGGIQVFCLLFTIPMFIYGKRARYATSRWGLVDKW